LTDFFEFVGSFQIILSTILKLLDKRLAEQIYFSVLMWPPSVAIVHPAD